MSETPAPSPGLQALLLAWRDRRLGTIFVLGMASGFPWVLIGSAMSAWLEELGISRSAIGLLGGVGIAYALNFLWAPFLDRYRPWFFARLGLRRSWIVLTQCLLLVCTLAVSMIEPGADLQLTGLVLLSIAVASATQDVAIDAYRVELIERSDQARISYGAAMATSGWWTGYGLLGALPFWLVDGLDGGWNTVYQGLALVWILFIVFVLFFAPMPGRHVESRAASTEPALRRLVQTVVRPLQDFLVRNGVALALSLMAFVLLFKVGEAFLGRMSIVFYKEIGFSNSEIGTYSKLLNWWVTVLFSILGSLVNARFGILKGLVIGGLSMAATNLMFAWMAVAGPETWLFALTVIVDGFTAALGTVAFMAFITLLTSHSFSATQYALLASIGNLGRTTLASSSGWVVDQLGGNWALFFVLTAVAVLPSMLLLWWLAPTLRERYPDAFGRVRPRSRDGT
jgi:PAT family beta-lactamase induction signal transducer AmpG